MSEIWSHNLAHAATRVEAWARPAPAAHFRPWSAAPGEPRPGANDDFTPAAGPAAPPEEPVPDIETIRADAFTQGFDQGRQTALAELAQEREALARLIRSAEALQPEPAGPLAAVLAETVTRLVRQIVGEVRIDPALLRERTEAIAGLVTAECGPARLRVHPDDIALLDGFDPGIALAPDPQLVPGTLLLETGEGWIEDGPQVRLARLRARLDGMGLPR